MKRHALEVVMPPESQATVLILRERLQFLVCVAVQKSVVCCLNVTVQ